jgi:hypothetical protein
MELGGGGKGKENDSQQYQNTLLVQGKGHNDM